MARRKTPATGAPRGVLHPRARFDGRDVRLIRRLASRGWSHREIATYLTEAKGRRVYHSTVGYVVRGERYE